VVENHASRCSPLKSYPNPYKFKGYDFKSGLEPLPNFSLRTQKMINTKDLAGDLPLGLSQGIQVVLQLE
jgi:hypothetical protein